MKNYKHNNKVAFITGGSKGIGFGIVLCLLQEGFKVAFTSRTQEGINSALGQLKAFDSTKIEGIVAAVQDYNAMEMAMQTCIEKLGYPDIVVANAGVGHFGSIEELSLDIWHETINTNVTGVFNTVKVSTDALKKTKGLLVSIASLAGTNFFAGGAAYNASKFAVVGFTQAVMLDLRKYGIRVSTLMPGSVTSYFNGHTPNVNDAWKIQPEDIAQMILDLFEMNPRTLPSKIEVRPTMPGGH